MTRTAKFERKNQVTKRFATSNDVYRRHRGRGPPKKNVKIIWLRVDPAPLRSTSS